MFLRTAKLQQRSVYLGLRVLGILTQQVGPLLDPILSAVRDSLRRAVFNTHSTTTTSPAIRPESCLSLRI